MQSDRDFRMKLWATRCQRISPLRNMSTDGNDGNLNGHTNKIVHMEYEEPIYPEYIPRTGESFQVKKARVLYQSRKRGMTENGLILSYFAKEFLNTFNEKELDLYDELINQPSNDWEIYYWAAGVKPVPEKYNHEIMDLLKKFVVNTEGKKRLMQPDLPKL